MWNQEEHEHFCHYAEQSTPYKFIQLYDLSIGFLFGYVLEKVQNSEARKLNFCAWARLLKFQESGIWTANILFEINTSLFNYFVQTSEVCK